jgi:AAA+ superfamily predicted ATPase
MKERITSYIRAGYPGLCLVSPEEQRVEAEIKIIAQDIGFKLFAWSVTEGVVDTEKGAAKQASDPLEALLAVPELPEKSILILRDFQLFLMGDPNPVLVRQIKDLLAHCKTESKVLLFLGCRCSLPPELERELTVIEFALPGKIELGRVLDGIVESAKLNGIQGFDRDPILDAAGGLTTIEAENAFALSIVETKEIQAGIVSREKAATIRKNGLLEIISANEPLEKIGGLDRLKEWLLARKNAFSQKAKDFGLPVPKGLLIVGIPGTGKSLSAKATAGVFGVPLLKLDAGRIFAGIVGQSEANLRSVIQTAEAIAPCVLWIEEIEKGFSGSRNSGSTDGGTSARVFGSFLSWMQEKSAPVFVVATANDASQLPPEFLRKGRWDELFFVDLPNQVEREAIWRIQIKRFNRNPKDFDIIQLARASEGFTGSEIECLFSEALYSGFNNQSEPTDLTIAQVMTQFVPLSKLMNENITILRKWASGRARFATSPAEERKLRKLAA